MCRTMQTEVLAAVICVSVYYTYLSVSGPFVQPYKNCHEPKCCWLHRSPVCHCRNGSNDLRWSKMTIAEQQGPEPEWWEKQTGWREDGAPTNLFLIPGSRIVSPSNNNLQTTQQWLLIGWLIRYSHYRAITVKKRKQKGETTSVLQLTTQSRFAVHTDTPLLTGRQQLWLHSLYSSHLRGRRADSIQNWYWKKLPRRL